MFTCGVCISVTRICLFLLVVMVERMGQPRKARREGILSHVGGGVESRFDRFGQKRGGGLHGDSCCVWCSSGARDYYVNAL